MVNTFSSEIFWKTFLFKVCLVESYAITREIFGTTLRASKKYLRKTSKSIRGRLHATVKQIRNIKNIYGDIRGIYGTYTGHIRGKNGIDGYTLYTIHWHIRAYTGQIDIAYTGIYGDIRSIYGHIRHVLGNNIQCQMLCIMLCIILGDCLVEISLQSIFG